MSPLSIPTTSALTSAQVVPSTSPAVGKLLSRLTRSSLISLALDWLDTRNQDAVNPYLVAGSAAAAVDDANDMFPPARTRADLRDIYLALQSSKGSKRDVLDRILDGDWRHGLTLLQLAMADMQYLYNHPASQRWSALEIVPLNADGALPTRAGQVASLPRFHPSTFLRNLQSENLPDVKAHHNLDRHPTLPLFILRIFIVESPYNTDQALRSITHFDASRTIYVGFPDASPYVYISLRNAAGLSSSSEAKSLRRLAVDSIPKAFSKPRHRYRLVPTELTARNLEALTEMRGGGRTNAAGGGWAVYAKKNDKDTPLHRSREAWKVNEDREDSSSAGEALDEQRLPIRGKRQVHTDLTTVKRRKIVAEGRFGTSSHANDGKGIERLDVHFQESFPSPPSHDGDPPSATETWRPDVRVVLHGAHVFAGVRELVEAGIIDGEKMAGWLTGSEQVSVGIVKQGRLQPRAS